MNKFKHFSYNDLNIRKIEKLNKIKLEFEDSHIDDDGRDYYDYDERVTLDFSGENARQHCVDIINAALDARLIQRVAQDKEETENKYTYTLKELPDGKVWMMENLREKVEGAVWNEKYNCYMYTFEQAQKAVPEGFHLPSAQEFMKLAMALGYLKDNEEIVSERLQEYCGFVFSGFAYDTGSLRDQGRYGYYWSSAQYNAGVGYHLFFSSEMEELSYSSTDYRMAVRLVKD